MYAGCVADNAVTTDSADDGTTDSPRAPCAIVGTPVLALRQVARLSGLRRSASAIGRRLGADVPACGNVSACAGSDRGRLRAHAHRGPRSVRRDQLADLVMKRCLDCRALGRWPRSGRCPGCAVGVRRRSDANPRRRAVKADRYDAGHRSERQRWAAIVLAGFVEGTPVPCARCGEPIGGGVGSGPWAMDLAARAIPAATAPLLARR